MKLLSAFKTALILSAALTSACGSLKVDICISDPKSNGFRCVDPNKKAYFLSYANSDNFVAVSPDDFEKILNELKKCKR